MIDWQSSTSHDHMVVADSWNVEAGCRLHRSVSRAMSYRARIVDVSWRCQEVGEKEADAAWRLLDGKKAWHSGTRKTAIAC